MPVCIRCKKESGDLGGLFGFNQSTGRCSTCESHVKQTLYKFRQSFLKFCEDGLLSDQEWLELDKITEHDNVDWNEALSFVLGDTLHFLERTMTFISADGIITVEEEQYFNELIRRLSLPSELVSPIFARFNYLKGISEIRYGKLPVVQPSVHLESGEICHLETRAIYYKVRTSSVLPISGRIIATDKKVHFLSESGGLTIAWKNIMRVDHDSRFVFLQLSTKKGNGQYGVDDPLQTEAILTTLTRIAKRQLIVPWDDAESRHIPQDVRNAVWQRDQGKCVQCGATSYLEYDHIIPFSRGGANTVNNVQLLCRRCNLEKRDRI